MGMVLLINPSLLALTLREFAPGQLGNGSMADVIPGLCRQYQQDEYH